MKLPGLPDRFYESDYEHPAIMGSLGVGVTAVGGVCDLAKIPEVLSGTFLGAGLGVMAVASIVAGGVAALHKLGIEVPPPVGK